MKEMGYGHNYLYPHNYPGNFVRQQYMPDTLGHPKFYVPGNNPPEARSAELHRQRWGEKDEK